MNSGLADACELIQIRSNIRDLNSDKGKLDIRGVLRLLRLCLSQIYLTFRARPQLTYTLLSQNPSGFARDTCYILLARLLGQRVVVHFRGGGFTQFYGALSRSLQAVVRFVVRRTDKVIVQADCLRHMFEDIVGADRVSVVPNGVDLTAWPRPEAAAVDDSSHQAPLRVLFVGHLSAAKGLGDLLEAVPKVLRALPHTEFILAGETLGKERNIMTDAGGRSLGVESLDEHWRMIEQDEACNRAVHALGTVFDEQKYQTFANADLFVLPSHSEGFPLSMLEAMAAGLPVVCCAVGAIPEIISDGENGRLVQPGEPDELAEAIIDVLENEGKRHRMSETNRRAVTELYDIERVWGRLLRVFEDVADASSPGY